MNRIRNAVRLRRKESQETTGKKSEGEINFQSENSKGLNIVGKENSGEIGIPEILSYFPELYVDSSNGFSANGGGVGQMICGTISSFFEDTWNRAMCEMKQVKSRNIYNLSSDLSLGIHLKREWHRLWLVRSFLAFAWESYLEDLMIENDKFPKEYLNLPSYGTNLEGIGKISLGEILCIVSSSKLTYSEKSTISIPFSTIQGKMIIKKSLSFNYNLHWKTPTPNTVAKFRVLQDQKKLPKTNTSNLEGGDSVYMSLDIDNPQLLWKSSFSNQIPKEFEDLQTLASSVRVLRKDETAKFTIDGKKSIVIKLLNWYRETQDIITYENKNVNCKYFIEQEDFYFDNDLNNSQIQGNVTSVEYYITSDDNRKRKLFTGLTYISNGSYFSPMLGTVMRGNSKAVIYITKELANLELGILKKHSDNSKFSNCLRSIVTGMDSGKRYFLHLEIPSIEKELQDLQIKEKNKTLMFKHVIQDKKQFESRIQLLQDLKAFGHLVLSKFSIGNGESAIIENVYIREIGNNPILLETLRVKLNQHLLENNLFEVPFVVFEIENHSKSKSQAFIVCPCIRNHNELLFYSHFRWLKGEYIKKKRFEISPNEAYSRHIFGDLRQTKEQNHQRNDQIQMGMSHYNKGVTLLVELGRFNFHLEEGILEDLRDNRSIYSLEWEFEWLNNNSEGGLSLFFHVLRTSFFILYESYGGAISDLNQVLLDTLNFANIQKWKLSLRFEKMMEFLILETKKRAGSIYFNIIGLLSQLLMEIHLEGKTSKRLVEEILNKVRESMKHASVQIILLDYLVTWILINVSVFKVCTKDLSLKLGSIFQNLLVFHRICRKFLQDRKDQVQIQLEILCEKMTFTGIINSILPVTTSNMKGENGKEAFFKYIMRFYIFEKLSQFLVNPMDAETQYNNEKISYFNLLREEPKLDILSLGDNRSGVLGLGPPRIQLFSDLECNLYRGLSKINETFLLDRVEEEKTKILQNVIISDESFLVKGISSIAYGTDHIVILGKEGDILIWGSNSSGQCCIEKKPISKKINTEFNNDKDSKELLKRIEDYENTIFYPTRISCFSNICDKITISKIDCGAFFTLALDHNGDLFSWGQGRDGSLGTGSYEDSFVPQKIKLKNKVKSFSAGMFHCGAIDEKNQLYVWGSNEFGQLGTKLYMDNKNLNTPFKILVKFSRSSVTSSKITLVALDKEDSGNTEEIVEWKGVSFGEAHSIALDTNGLVWVWGQNNLKQLTGIPEILETEIMISNNIISSDYYKKLCSQVIFPTPLVSTEKVVVFASRKINMIFSGSNTCCAIDEQGKPWIWGLSFSGIDHHNVNSIFSRKNTSGSTEDKNLIEFEFPVRVFRNITPDYDSIRTVRFGKGNNNISMVSRLGRCYLWLENKDLVTDQMKYLNNHNCFILEDLQSISFRNNHLKNSRHHSILDVALLSDSIIFLTKKTNKDKNN
ncbi:Regulator of chromosome condensation (RCC1) repeat family protein [Cryptosporidium hominis]|nr:Regulator of chromosome condensation (RCC1) repeat [Cryptosporidium hominis]PPA63524.1 Regulator of chromosome condensation (RCC1) repeat family protein [Cryptosporidium hominis]